MTDHQVVSREEWTARREDLLAREKAHTRERDALAQARRELPWVRVDKEYVFDTAAGPKTLAELFDGRSQLVVYHFMFGLRTRQVARRVRRCRITVHALPHLHGRVVMMTYVSQASLDKLEAFKRRMGWHARGSLRRLATSTSTWAMTDRRADAPRCRADARGRSVPPGVEQNANVSGNDRHRLWKPGPGSAFVNGTGTRRRLLQPVALESSWATTDSWTARPRDGTRVMRPGRGLRHDEY